MRHLDDEGILDLFYERSEQAVTELDRKYGAAVRRTAGNILRDRLDVEECLNDTWLAAWNTIPPQRPDPLVSYVCRIARNLAVKRWRAETAAKRNGNYDLVLDELEECISSGVDVESELEREDRVLFVRRYFFAEPVAQIAAATRFSANRTSVRLFRLREKLRNYLQKEGLSV